MKPLKKTKKIDGKMMSLYNLLFLLGKFTLVLPYVTLPEFVSLNKANIDCKIKELERNNIIDKLFFFFLSIPIWNMFIRLIGQKLK